MHSAKSQRLQFALGLGVSLALVVWLLSSLNWSEVGQELIQSNFWVLLPATGLIFVHYILRALRWRELLARGREVSLRDLFDCIALGNFANFILPLRAGEFVRPYVLSERSPIHFSAGFSSVVIERFFDLSTVLVTFSLMLRWVPGVPDWAHHGATTLTILAAGILVFIVLSVLAQSFVDRLVAKLLSFFPEKIAKSVGNFLTEFIGGAQVLGREGRLFKTVAYTVLIWASCYGLYWIYLYLLPLPQDPGFAVVIAVILALAVAAPSAPGFVGVYQTACVAAFALYGISAERAVAYALITHVHQYVLFIAYGIYVLFRLQIGMKDLRPEKK